jgi:predicted O-methyltransferase YrrM
MDPGNARSVVTTLAPEKRAYLVQAATSVRHLPGAAAEVGVYRGGSLVLIAGTLREKRVYGIDTFTGMPSPSTFDEHVAGAFSDTSLEQVTRTIEAYGYENVTLLPGFFPDVVATLDERFCFVHVDCDLYSSVRDCCTYFWPRLVPGGIMIFDDYVTPDCPGARRATDDFVAESAPSRAFLNDSEQFVVVK